MVQSDISDLFRALVHVGTVDAVRQQYRVFRSAGGDYVVFSPSSRGSLSYFMTIVSSTKVEALFDAMGKEGVTTGSLMKDKKLEDAFGPGDEVAARFDILMALYVLAALGKASMEKEGRNLIFRKASGKG
jgi:hypothetical protein